MSAPRLPPGTVIGNKYQVGTCIGFSGAAATYLAVGSDHREVVLKLFDPAIRQRSDIMGAIEQTYAASNALPPEIVIPLLDAGYDPASGAPYSASERVPFPSLAQLAAQRPLSPDEAANILSLMAQALDQAHGRQLFHHALKPTNVFIGFAQGYGLRMTDFGAGLARIAVPTQEGYALAAPWLAPEQAQGNAAAGAPADVFSAALVVFYALTGKPYWRSTQGALDVQAWQREIMEARTAPSQRARELGVPLSQQFDSALGCALAADPALRYRSLGEFANAVEMIINGGGHEAQATLAIPASALGVGVAASFSANAALHGPAAGIPAASPPPANPFPAMPAPSYPGAASPGPTLASPMTSPVGSQGPVQQPYAAQAHAMGRQDLDETRAGRTILGEHARKKPKANSAVIIIVGVAIVVLLGGGALALVLMGRKGDTSTQAAKADSSSATTASAAAADTSRPVEPAAATATAATEAPTAADSPKPPADVDAGPPPVEVTLSCDPDCDDLKVDGNPFEAGKALALPPGKHTVVATKAGYTPQKDTLNLKAGGDKVEKTYKLVKPSAAAPVGPQPVPQSGTPTKKPCSKFLKNCK